MTARTHDNLESRLRDLFGRQANTIPVNERASSDAPVTTVTDVPEHARRWRAGIAARRPSPERATRNASVVALLGAAAVVVAIVAFAALGSHTRPRGPRAALGDLQRRPLQLPRLSPAERCPVTTERSQPTAALGVMLGHGAVRPVGVPDGVLRYVAPSDDPLNAFRGSAWGGNKVLWAVGPTVRGDVLIRGRQLDGSGGLRFGMGVTPDAQLLLRAIDASPDRSGWRGYPSETRVQHRGCYGYQIDTASASAIVVVSVE